MATTVTVAQFFLHRHIFRPLCAVPFSLLHPPKKLSFSLLKPQKYPFLPPLFCTLEENKNLNFDDFKDNEENPVVKIQEENPVVKIQEENPVAKIQEENPVVKIHEIKQYKELPNLTVKEKKDLCSFANSLGDKLKSQQVGKSGVTDNVVFALSETLEANELLKLKIHRTCPGEMEDVVKQLELATGSVVVAQIGRTVIFYRPSITKLEAEKKREHSRKVFAQRREKAQAAFMKREQLPRRPGRGQYGSRRSENLAS